MNNCLFTRLLIRFIKDNGLYVAFSSNININAYNIMDKWNMVNSSSLYLIRYYMFKEPKNKYFNKITSFLIEKTNQRKFNKMLMNIAKNHFINFLIENDIIDIFSINLQNDKKIYSNLKTIPAILQFLDDSDDKGISPFCLFKSAFRFNYTNEGIDFWTYKSYEFNKYMIKILEE